MARLYFSFFVMAAIFAIAYFLGVDLKQIDIRFMDVIKCAIGIAVASALDDGVDHLKVVAEALKKPK